jgi:hypothetical protein
MEVLTHYHDITCSVAFDRSILLRMKAQGIGLKAQGGEITIL